MSEILITGIEMPKEGDTYGLHLVIYPNGDVWIAYDDKPTGKAKELPTHGELCDKDKLKEATKNTVIQNSRGEVYQIGKAIAMMIDQAPVVVEATE